MFEDRDLYILGSGGLLAIFFLLPSWPFWLKVSLALIVMVVSLVVALMRFGSDRVTIEEQLIRIIKYRNKAKDYSYYGGKVGRSSSPLDAQKSSPGYESAPVTLAWDDANIYALMTVWLAVIGIYFLVWLKNTGQFDLALWVQQISKQR